jgi:hypothetical protein
MDLPTSFRQLSSLLTGVECLDERVAEHYRSLVLTRFGPGHLDEILAAYDEAAGAPCPLERLTKLLAADRSGRLAAVAKQIVKLWYFSQFNDPDQGGRLANAGLHARALAWPLVKAHPPSDSTSPHGYWTDEPKS